MDKTGAELQSHITAIENHLSHPISVEIERDRNEREAQLEKAIMNIDPTSIGDLITHFLTIGELRGLRRGRVQVTAKLEELKEELKEAIKE
jgi:predicted transcriptional regulator